MKEFFRTLSRGTIACLVIVIAIILIVAEDPPHNICHSERDQFLQVQKKFMKADDGLVKAFKKAKAPYQRLYDSCKDSENSGGCLEYFIKLKKFVSDFNVVSSSCKKTAMKEKTVAKIFNDSTKLFVNLAWGEGDTDNMNGRFAWFDQSDLDLFCRLKENLKQGSSKSGWENKREAIMSELSGAENMSRDQLWKNSILSVPCNKIL